MNRLAKVFAAALAAVALAGSAQAYEAFKGPLGLLHKAPGTFDGYTLIAPQRANITYLIDMDGNVVHEWKSDYGCFYAELMPNGNLIRHSTLPGVQPGFGGQAGLFEEFDWDGKKVWEYKSYIPNEEVSHHTFEVMPNGNLLILVWKKHSYEDALAKGLKPDAICSRKVSSRASRSLKVSGPTSSGKSNTEPEKSCGNGMSGIISVPVRIRSISISLFPT